MNYEELVRLDEEVINPVPDNFLNQLPISSADLNIIPEDDIT
jgi:hypothetical protein